jgi:hypothetical protein
MGVGAEQGEMRTKATIRRLSAILSTAPAFSPASW